MCTSILAECFMDEKALFAVETRDENVFVIFNLGRISREGDKFSGGHQFAEDRSGHYEIESFSDFVIY